MRPSTAFPVIAVASALLFMAAGASAENVPAQSCTGQDCMRDNTKPAEVCQGRDCDPPAPGEATDCDGRDCQPIPEDNVPIPEDKPVEPTTPVQPGQQ